MSATRLSDCVFKPASVALVGASGDPKKTTARPFQFLQQHGYQGRVHVVNPRQKEVFGHSTVPSIEDLPETPDHAYILLNTDGAMEAARHCAKRGVPVVSILASGFSESGAEGLAREQELRALVRETGTRIIGPNCLGVVNTHNGMSLTANAAFFEPKLDPGRFMLVSQSGSMLGSLLSRAQDRGLGFSRIVSVGNEVDMDIGTLSMGSVEDPEVEGFLLFLETIRQAESLTEFAAAAHAAGKPVLAYKLGRSLEGQELAVSHTGAMLSDDSVADTFLRDNGIARVTHLESLFESAPLFAGWSKTPRKRGTVGVVTTTGGGAAMVVDQLGVEGVSVVGPTEGTLSKLAEAGLEVSPGRIIDLTLAGANYDAMTAALKVLRNAEEFDVLIIVIGSSARTMPQQTIQPILDGEDNDKPLAVFVVPEAPHALRLMADAGIPAFRTPESCADAVGAFLDVRVPRLPGRMVAAYEGERNSLSEKAAMDLFADLGVPVAQSLEIDVTAALPEDLPFSYPVVAKALSEELSHKTEAGGVVLDIKGPEELRAAVESISRNVRERAGIAVEQILIAPQVKGVTDLLLGYADDPQVGPVVILSQGGVLAELSKERIIRLAPVDEATALEMVDSLTIAPMLKGYRGGARADIEALVRTIVAFSQIAEHPKRAILEAEINPLSVQVEGAGVIPLDALAVVASDR